MAAALASKEKGNAAFKQGQYEQALAHYTVAIDLDPSSAIYRLNRCAVLLKLARWKQAEKDAKKASELEPGNVKALFRRGVALRELGKHPEARQQLEEAKTFGGGAEIDAELAKLPAVVPSSAPTAEPAQSPVEKPAAEAEASTSAFSTERLKKALKPIESTSGSNDEFMRPVSTKRLKKAAGTAPTAVPEVAPIIPAPSIIVEEEGGLKKPASFAEAKAARQARLASSSPVPSASTPKPPPAPTTHHHHRRRSSAAARSPMSPKARERALQEDESVEDECEFFGALPKTGVEFESTWKGTVHASIRLSLLRQLIPDGLPTLFGASLSPDLLSEMVRAIAPPSRSKGSTNSIDMGKRVDFLEGLTKVQRFWAIAGFLSEEEKRGLRGLLEDARELKVATERVDRLEKEFELD